MSQTLPPPPVLKTTTYDVVSAFLLSVAGGLVAVVVLLGCAWYVTRVPAPHDPVKVDYVEVTGGSPEGATDETLQVESPEPESADASMAEVQADETEIKEVLENVLEMSDDQMNLAERQFELDVRDAGKPGSSKGTGRRPLGEGPGSGGGVAREQRWFIRYAEGGGIEEYAKQLDYFKIELGAIVNGELVYLSNLGSPAPTVRRVKSGAAEGRLYFTWQGGLRRGADIELFKKAGIDVGNAALLQFVPKDREAELANLEIAAARRGYKEIRRTYFGVRKQERSPGYEFFVTRQIFFEKT